MPLRNEKEEGRRGLGQAEPDRPKERSVQWSKKRGPCTIWLHASNSDHVLLLLARQDTQSNIGVPNIA